MTTSVKTAEYACKRLPDAEEKKLLIKRYYDPTILTGKESEDILNIIMDLDSYDVFPDDDFEDEVKYTVNLEDKLKIDELGSIRFSVGDDVEVIKEKMADSRFSIRDKFLAFCIMANLNPDAFESLDSSGTRDRNIRRFGPSKFSEGYNGNCIYI